MSRSPSISPSLKRHRLSSPTYEDQVEPVTAEELAAFDAFELRLSQQVATSTLNKRQKLDYDDERDDAVKGSETKEDMDHWGSSQPQAPTSSFLGFSFGGKNIPTDDLEDNPFAGCFSSAEKLKAPTFKPPSLKALVGFASASKLSIRQEDHKRSLSPETPPPDLDYDSWFAPVPEKSIGFTTPAFAPASIMGGFTTASKKGMIMPSKVALEKAKAKIDAWNREEEKGTNTIKPPSHEDTFQPTSFLSNSTGNKQTTFELASSSFITDSPRRTAFQSVTNIMSVPDSPSPAGFSRPSIESPVAGPSKPSNATPNIYRSTQFKPPFKTPHIPNTTSGLTNALSSPLNLDRSTTSLGFTSAASQHSRPLAAPPITVPRAAPGLPVYNNMNTFATPLRQPRGASKIKTTPAPFKTPFKPGMRPGEPGHASLLVKNIKTPLKSMTTTPTQNRIPTKSIPPSSTLPRTFFNTSALADRISLATSGLVPQQYDVDELEYMGINTIMLSQITPETAMYYTFHTTESTPPVATASASPKYLGPAEALKELLNKGCTLATKPWVDNHWCLIIWKLAGMVGLDPKKEKNPDETRWCWGEVMRQLLYRYERELNGGVRPPLRKIANQDAPAAFPMVLCVSNIFWSPAGLTDDGMPIEPHPELEVTDGWYRLRATLDLPMARAVRRRIIRIGRKIGVAGARLSTEKKEPSEILEAYNSTKLEFSGNSSNLMPWHTKLGFMRGPCISTLHSLTHDGGIVTALDFVIIKLYSIAFIEFKEDENGHKYQEGPRKEPEENEVNGKWKRNYELEASKLRSQYEKKYFRYDNYIDKLERKAGNGFRPGEDDCPPDNMDSLYDELEYPDAAASVISRINPLEAGWLALHIRKQSELGRERIAEEIEQELKTICPPRNVRSFRMLAVQDARTLRRPANRVALLNVWDILELNPDEDGAKGGGFEIGQRYLATNLVPKQMSAWMDNSPGSEIYLSSTRATRWTRIPVSKQ